MACTGGEVVTQYTVSALLQGSRQEKYLHRESVSVHRKSTELTCFIADLRPFLLEVVHIHYL